jgi:hypothetical protein
MSNIADAPASLIPDAILRDIISHMISLIPLDDHSTVSAMSSTCHTYSGAYAQWLHVNGIVDLRAIGPDDPIDLCDQFHGTLHRMLSYQECYIICRRLRAHVFYKNLYSDDNVEFVNNVTMRFEYGVPVYMKTIEPQRITILECSVINGIEVIVDTYVSPPGPICSGISGYASIGIVMYNGQLIRNNGHTLVSTHCWSTGWCYIHAPSHELEALDVDSILAPYQEQAIRLYYVSVLPNPTQMSEDLHTRMRRAEIRHALA